MGQQPAAVGGHRLPKGLISTIRRLNNATGPEQEDLLALDTEHGIHHAIRCILQQCARANGSVVDGQQVSGINNSDKSTNFGLFLFCP